MEHLILFLEIVLINLVLSGDNAVVIAMASQKLPPLQQKKAVWWGAAGAVGLRIILTFAAVQLLHIPLLQAGGALLLFYIAFKLLTDDHGDAEIKTSTSLLTAVKTIIMADFIMSLDNVIAIAAIAQGNTALLIAGVATSIPLIIWGSTLIMRLLSQYPVLNYIGAAILGYTAGEMFVKDEQIAEWFEHVHSSFHWFIPIAFVILILASGFIGKRVR